MTERAVADTSGPAPRRGSIPPEADVREALDTIVLGSLSPVTAALALLYVAFTIAHARVLPPNIAPTMMIVSGSTAVLLAGLLLLLSRATLSSHLAHLIGAGIAILVLANSLTHLYLTLEPEQTTNLLLLILGVGILFLDAGWFAVIVFATYLGWFFIVSTAPSSPEWVHFGFSLLAATVLASAILALRIRTFGHLEELRMQDRVRQLELEASLSRTEAARRGEEGARVELERALSRIQESEGRFRRLAESTFEGVTVYQDERIVDANERTGELFRHRLLSIVGRRIDDLVAPESLRAVTDLIRAAEEDTTVATRKIRAEAVKSDANRFPVEISVSPASHQGRPALVMLFRDITEQLQLEEVLRRAASEAEAQSRAKSTFLANMSHELRTPLNAVIGFANILIRNQKRNLNDRDLEYLHRIESNGQHLLTLISDVLDVSKIEAGRMDVVMEPVDLDPLVRESLKALEIQARRRNLEMLIEIPSDLEPVMADAQRLRQVLLNLLGNAVKFTPSGWVAVRVVAEEGSRRPLRIEVEDSGVGIPPSEVNSIFNPFRQADTSSSRRFSGTGLGLTISRSLCEIMGFSLEVEKRERERGSLFTVLLHARDAHPWGAPEGP